MDVAEPRPDIKDLAIACVASVKATVGIELDFTQETLPLLDHYVRNELGDEREELLQLTVPMTGAYFGEVVRRELAAFRWHAPPGEHRLWRLELETAFLFFNPIGTALEVAQMVEAPGWWGHCEVRPGDRELLSAALESYGEVRERDYYSFAIRYEVIEQILGSLARESARVRKEGDPLPHVDPSLYDAVVQGRESSIH